MNAVATNYTLVLDAEEREELLRVLEQTLKDKSLEEHRTDALAYKEAVKHEERVLERLTAKVRALPG